MERVRKIVALIAVCQLSSHWGGSKGSMVLILVATVMGGYALAERLHVSGPLAMVVVGLYLGKTMQGKSVDNEERERLSVFWESLDHLLNAVLFTLVGFVLLGFNFQDLFSHSSFWRDSSAFR